MKYFILITTLLLAGFSMHAQRSAVFISGTVLDSASRQSLPYTAIQIKGKNIGQSTKDDGSFLISCNRNDTLIFSRLGHRPYLYIALQSEGPMKIFLAEDARMLKEVTIYDNYKISALEESKKSLPSDARVQLKSQTMEPPTNGVATFGPTVTFRLDHKDKEQGKRSEFGKTEVYRNVVNSPDVKKKIMELYAISEDEYLKRLERFNKSNPDVAYLTNREEIITMLVQFFAMK